MDYGGLVDKIEQALFDTLDTGENEHYKHSANFLRNLSNWIIDNYGNVNVAQQLSIIAISLEDKPS